MKIWVVIYHYSASDVDVKVYSDDKLADADIAAYMLVEIDSVKKEEQGRVKELIHANRIGDARAVFSKHSRFRFSRYERYVHV